MLGSMLSNASIAQWSGSEALYPPRRPTRRERKGNIRMNSSQALDRARSAAKRGEKAAARSILATAAKEDPENEEIYLCLAEVAEDREQKILALEHVERLNPNNQIALKALTKLRGSTDAQAAPAPVEGPGSDQVEFAKESQPAVAGHSGGGSRKLLLIGGAALVAVMCMGITLLVMLNIGDLLSGSLDPPPGSKGARFPLYPGAHEISLSDTDRAKVVEDVFGREFLLFSWNVDISWTEDTGPEVEQRLNELLPNAKWRQEMDWIGFAKYSGSEWSQGDLRARVLYIDNLSSEDVDELNRRYRISGPSPGSTLILVHVLDESLSLPDETATAEASIAQATGTASAIQHAATETAHVQLQEASATALHQSEITTATKVAEEISATATQVAGMTATAAVLHREELARLSDEFDGSVISGDWSIYRPDPASWDLTSRDGWLHIVGTEPAELGARNIFAQNVPPTDLSVITRLELAASDIEQYAWVAFSTGDYPGGYDQGPFVRIYFDLPHGTVELGVASTIEGTFVYMWSCDRDTQFGAGCGSVQSKRWRSGMHADSLGELQVSLDGPIHLRLDREGLHFAGYYSPDGISWSYVGEIDGFAPMTDQVYLGAIRGFDSSQFDVYYDFVRYELLER